MNEEWKLLLEVSWTAAVLQRVLLDIQLCVEILLKRNYSKVVLQFKR